MEQIFEIPIDNIIPNKSQPREEFDKEKVQELAESIVSSGLINPITVRKLSENKYIIVAGERRWKASKLAGNKNIKAIIKDYKDEIDWQVESLIENIQREDLTSVERENNIYDLWKTGKFTTYKDLAKKLGISYKSVVDLIEAKETRKEASTNVSSRVIIDTRPLDMEDRKKIFKGVEKKEIFPEKVREVTRVMKVAPKDVKDAFFNNKISVKQAEAISKLKDSKQREQAIKDHEEISKVDTTVEKRIKKAVTSKDKREFNKKLAQAKNWIASFRGSVTDTNTSIEKTIKILLVATQFVPLMDDKEKQDLDYHLGRFLERLNRATQITDKIQEMIK